MSIHTEYGQVDRATPLLKFYRFLASSTTKTAVVLLFDKSGVVRKKATLTATTTGTQANGASVFDSAWSENYVGMYVISANASIYALPSNTTPDLEVDSTVGAPLTLAAGTYLGVVPPEYVALGNALTSAAQTPLPPANMAGAVTETTPTVANTTSVQLLAANSARKYLLVQNNTAANILISLSGNTLTGIAPTSSNKGFVLAAGASYSSDRFCPTSAVTCYQSSGGSVNTISVAEG